MPPVIDFCEFINQVHFTQMLFHHNTFRYILNSNKDLFYSILIVILYSRHGAPLLHVLEFGSINACESAGEKIIVQLMGKEGGVAESEHRFETAEETPVVQIREKTEYIFL